MKAFRNTMVIGRFCKLCKKNERNRKTKVLHADLEDSIVCVWKMKEIGDDYGIWNGISF